MSPTAQPTGGLFRGWLMSLAGAVSGSLVGCGLVAAWGSVAREVPHVFGLGLVTPVAWLLAVVLGTWTFWMHSGRGEAGSFLSSAGARLGFVLSAPLALLVWYLVGKCSLRVFVHFEDRPALGGALAGALAVGMFAAATWLVRRGAQFGQGKLPVPAPRVALFLSGFILLVGIAILVFGGTTSGTGRPLALFGVLRREELELLPVFQALLLGAGAYGGAWFAGAHSARLVYGAAALALVCGGGALLRAHSMPFEHALTVERSGGLLSPALTGLRRLTDSDGDGFSAAFAGGDCQGAQSAIHPGAIDVPGNGIDEDCSGSDRVRPSKEAAGGAQAAAASEKPASLPTAANFLLLTIDTLRWDLGYARATRPAKLSPRLDALADRSTAFLSAYSLASYTSKSLGPMMIGRYPSETQRTFEHFDRFSPDAPWIQERLSAGGTHTASIQGYWYFFMKGYGFERGWKHLDSSAAPKQVKIEGDNTYNGDKIADQTIAHLKTLAASKERFFVWAHWVDPHSEYVRHPDFDFGDESRQRYDSEVAFVDAQVGRILDTLGETGLAESTVVLVTSDHGEAFGEHGMIRHGFEVWEELVRVPLIVHVPGAPPKRITERRSLIDVAPTVLETFAVKEPTVRGTSLYRDVFLEPGKTPDSRAVLVDMPEGPHNKERRAYLDGKYKIIMSQGRTIGIFDLEQDPGEKNDLSGDAALRGELEKQMNAFVDGLEQVKVTR